MDYEVKKENFSLWTCEATNFKNGGAIVKRDEKYGLINREGKEVVPLGKYEDISQTSENGLFQVRRHKRKGYINTDGKEVINPDNYKYVSKFNNGMVCVKSKGDEGQKGYLNKDGVEVIPLGIYDWCRSFSDGLAAVSKNDKYGYINTKGKVVIDFVYDSAEEFAEGRAWVKKDGRTYLIDTEGKEFAVEGGYSYGEKFEYGLSKVYNNGMRSYINFEDFN